MPFGLYHYTGDTRAAELFLYNVPFFSPLSFPFLAYASFCLARRTFGPRWATTRGGRTRLVLVAGALMMLLDVVIDPAAVRGGRWFLGHIFYYPEGGIYFGVPLSNFAGWVIVGTVGVGLFLTLQKDDPGRRTWPGVALYYAVLGFNLTMTVLIGELLLAVIGATIHVVLALSVWSIHRKPGAAMRPQSRGMQRL